MKHLFLIRHGKATQELMPDLKRPLIEKGIKRTKKRAKALQSLNFFPDLIVSSPAVRAYETAKIMANILNYNPDNIVINNYFYFYPEQEVIREISQFPDDKNTVFMFGHNPVWTDLADTFSENGLWHLRTSGVLGIEIDTDTWQNFEKAPKKQLVLIN